ncbi:PGG domain-containing protein [Heracleum sosnowskyi]|uniref:PGG domain-containing protein n=1 Tax=Heracleum sosnowskyi TaxID=360622 RepID=A0AAD8HRG9_9APIA|nr:PGG domain-containing protein [Heracleum sosnowskyi]
MEKIYMVEKQLYDATLKGDVRTLEALMGEDELLLARVSVTSCFNQTPLHIAAMLGHFEYAKSLLQYKPNFATRLDSQDRSPLHLASANGCVNIVSLLLQEDPSVCLVRDEDGRTPLHLAMMNGQYESINKLVEAKPDVTCYTLDHGETILHSCVTYNRLRALILLIESTTVDEDLTNVKDGSGNTILHTATALKRTQQVKYLLTRTEMRVNEVNGKGLTALDITEEIPKDVKTIEIKELLISHGAIRAKELGNTSHQLATDVTTNAQILNEPRCNRRLKLLRKVKKWSILKKKGENKGDSLLVAATVIAAMAYQASISPPGGVIGMDASEIKVSTGNSIEPGTSILAHYDPRTSKLFWMFNTISFIASLSIIFLFVSGISAKRKIFIRVLRAAMWIIVSSMALAYLVAVATFIPGPNRHHNSTYVTLLIAAITWDGLIFVSFLFLTYYFIRAASRKVKQYRKRFLRNRREAVLTERTRIIV